MVSLSTCGRGGIRGVRVSADWGGFLDSTTRGGIRTCLRDDGSLDGVEGVAQRERDGAVRHDAGALHGVAELAGQRGGIGKRLGVHGAGHASREIPFGPAQRHISLGRARGEVGEVRLEADGALEVLERELGGLHVLRVAAQGRLQALEKARVREGGGDGGI